MKKILFALSPIFFLILFSSCSHSQCKIPKGIYQIQGLWETKNNERILYEHWVMNPDSTLRGKSYTLKSDTDTLILEELEISCKNDTVYYAATVPDQNDGRKIYFKIIEFTPMVFVFENKQHDFPQMITYSVKTEDLFAVILEGPEEGNKIKSIEYRFTRKKE